MKFAAPLSFLFRTDGSPFTSHAIVAILLVGCTLGRGLLMSDRTSNLDEPPLSCQGYSTESSGMTATDEAQSMTGRLYRKV